MPSLRLTARVEVRAADLDRLEKTDFPPLADEHLRAACAHIHQDMHFLLVFPATHEAVDRAVQGTGLDIQGIDHQTGAMKLLDEPIHIRIIARP